MRIVLVVGACLSLAVACGAMGEWSGVHFPPGALDEVVCCGGAGEPRRPDQCRVDARHRHRGLRDAVMELRLRLEANY